jgi:hypothetical protein
MAKNLRIAGRGAQGFDVLPAGWIEGRDINTMNPLIKYLGMFLGAPADVAKNRKKKSPARSSEDTRIARGISRSHSGRKMAIRNHVNSVARYLVQAQTQPNLMAMLTTWRAIA